MNYTTLNEIVKNAMIDIGENTEHLYQRLLHWAFEGLRDYHYDTAKEVKTISIPMTPTKTIDIPNDCVDWTKIGIVVGNRVWTFAVNNQLELRKEKDECGNPLPKPTHQLSDATAYDLNYYGGYWFHNYSGSRLFAYGGASQNVGYYRVNRNSRQIEFDSEVNTSDIYLEYISNGINPTGESVVNQYAAKLLKLYVLWVRKENSNRFHMGEKERARTLYYNELRMVRARLSNFDVQDFIEATRKGYLDRLKAPSFIQDHTGGSINQPIAEKDCPDVFPDTIPKPPSDDPPKRYWGISTNPDIAGSGMVNQLILGLQSEFAESRQMTKTLDATGGNYLYFAYPVEWGKGSFVFNTFPTTFLEATVAFTNEEDITEDYYLYRSLNLQHGINLTVQIL